MSTSAVRLDEATTHVVVEKYNFTAVRVAQGRLVSASLQQQINTKVRQYTVCNSNSNWTQPYAFPPCVFCSMSRRCVLRIVSPLRRSQCPFATTSNSRRFRRFAKLDCWLLHVCPSVRMKQLGSRWKDFDGIWYLSFFFPRNSVAEIQVPLKSNKNNGYFTRRRFYIYENISLNFFRSILDKSCREIQNTRYNLYSVNFLKIVPFMR